MDGISQIESLLEKPYWVIDVLPKQVPAGGAGQFFAVEQHWLAEPQRLELQRRKLAVLLKLNCYYDLRVSADACETWEENPGPEQLRKALESYLYVLLPAEEALVTADPGDIYMTLYNASEDLRALAGQLAASEGLFVWQPPQG